MLGELVSHMGLQLVPYANLLVVSLMALTSDPLADVRMAATSAFCRHCRPAAACTGWASVLSELCSCQYALAMQEVALCVDEQRIVQGR